ncbi:hypothetical protein [Thalassotalea sp. PLHSN55]|uniref:hypothetical protein n=1 Tax=Thalassotalea sp. PLHSN55 TaxID=3435888 RepID=UPI003F878C30
MDIQSAFSSGVQGFQKATEDANQAAAGIARETSGADNITQTQAVPQTAENQALPAEQLPSLNQEIVNLKVAQHQAEASAQVIKSADESLGTLIDVTA